MGIKKQYITWEEFEQIQGGTWSPAAHTHVKADITDTPWAWADVLKTGSNLTDLATRQHAGLTNITSDQHHAQAHAASHHVAGADLLAFASITGFSTYLDQAVKQASNPTFANLTISTNLTTPKITIGAFYLNSLIANNKVPDSYKWHGYTPAGLTIGHVLKATGAAAFAFQANNLGGLSDVTLGSLEEGETIRYDQATTMWIDAWGIDYDNPRLVYKIYTEFISAADDTNDPWVGSALPAGGSSASVAGTTDHPGIVRFSSAAVLNSGYRFVTFGNCILIGGAEHSEFCFKTGPNLTDVHVRLGYQDSFTNVAPTDGVWIDMASGTLTGKTRNNGAESTTGTNHVLAINTWYRGKIAIGPGQFLELLPAGYVECVPGDIGKQVKDDGVEIGVLIQYDNLLLIWIIDSPTTIANGSVMTITEGTGAGIAGIDSLPRIPKATFILYSEAGAVLWTDNVTANIPIAAGRETGHGAVAWIGAGAARQLIDIDMMIATRAGFITR